MITMLDPTGTDLAHITKTYKHAVERLLALRQATPYLSTNQTDYTPFRNRPIVVTIETKIMGEAWHAARLQVGVWQIAHWRALRSLCTITVDEDMAEGAEQSAAREDTYECGEEDGDMALGVGDKGAPADRRGLQDTKVQEALDEVDFLPAIIIRGHDWWFVASTLEGNKTVSLSWNSSSFGPDSPC